MKVHDVTAYAIRRRYNDLKSQLAESDSQIERHEKIIKTHKRDRNNIFEAITQIESDAIALGVDLRSIR